MTDFYCGFYIDTPVGNNAFSFDRRSHKRIFVPALVAGDLDDVAVGVEVVFSEIVDGCQRNVAGLRNFVHHKRGSQDIFVFDNHNHAFLFWAWAVSCGRIAAGMPVVHVDQHKDTREPSAWLLSHELGDLTRVFNYVNFELNVGNFIPPAKKAGLVGDVFQLTHPEAFEQELPSRFILDIDMDIFSPEMSYFPDQEKLSRIRELLPRADVVTIATSPFFIDQRLAIERLKRLFII